MAAPELEELCIRLDEAIPPDPRCWEWVGLSAGRCVAHGTGTDELPRARRTTLLAPASRVTHLNNPLPRLSPARLREVLPNLFEDELILPSQNYTYTLLEKSADGRGIVAVVEREWLEEIDRATEALGLHDIRLLGLGWGLAQKSGEWVLWLESERGMLARFSWEGLPCENLALATPPACLEMALAEARQQGVVPQSIGVWLAPGVATPPLEAWQAMLGIPLTVRGTRDWYTMASARTLTLPVAMRSTRRKLTLSHAALRPWAWVAGVLLLLETVAVAAQWVTLTVDKHMVQQRIETLFRGEFGAGAVMVDPYLQMRRHYEERQRQSGASAASDLAPLLSRVSRAAGDEWRGTLDELSYEGNRLVLGAHFATEEQARNWAQRLRRAGLDVEETQKKEGSAVVARFMVGER